MKWQISYTKCIRNRAELDGEIARLSTTRIAVSGNDAIRLVIAALSRSLVDKNLLVEMRPDRILVFCDSNTEPIEVYENFAAMRVYVLLGADGKFYDSSTPGTVGGYRRKKIYGRLDCPSALSHIAKGHYVPYRVFFADEQTAIEAGYRPCGVCMKEAFKIWKQSQPLK